MIIRKVVFDNKKRCFYLTTAKGILPFPYSKLQLIPTALNKISRVYVDEEASKQWFGYVLESGKEDFVPLDAVLDYNKDPDYIRNMMLYKLSCQAQDIIQKHNLRKREIMRRLHMSPSQFYRLLDQTFYGKTIDQMFKLLQALDATIEVKVNNKKVA